MNQPTVVNLTDRQMLTVAAGLGVTLLSLYERVHPPHKRVSRKIKAVENAVTDLFAGAGEPVDQEILLWIARMWDQTMRNAEQGKVEV